MSTQDADLIKCFPADEGVHSTVYRSRYVSTHPVSILDGFSPHPAGLMPESLFTGPGISFSLAGKTNEETMTAFTLVSDSTDAGDPAQPVRTVLLEDKTLGLQLTMTYTYYMRRQAVVIGAAILNASDKPVYNLTELRSFNLIFDSTVCGDTTLHTIGGGTTHYFFPPLAFQLDTRCFLGSLSFGHPYRIDSGGTGRSSDKHMPFFHVEDSTGQAGIYGGFEWSGLWHIDFKRADQLFTVQGGIEGVDTTIRPGETIELPRAMLGFYQGSIHEGRNAMRRFISDWYPRWQGEDLGAPVTWNHAFTFCATISEEIIRRQAPVVADLGFEWMQIDWSWYAGCSGDFGTMPGIGNWERVDPVRFPNGIKPVADFVRSQGLKYCTWVDPEQAAPTSDLARQHPDWMLFIPGKTMGLVDFGRKDVQDHFIAMIGEKIVRAWGVHKLKWDNNIDPQPYWAAHESPKHQGMMQMRHIRGVYRVWDELRRLNPTLVLENCSSGGRRFDLGTFRHAHIHHGSDFNFQNDIIRTQISGLNTVVPSYRVIHTATWGGPESPDMYFQSRFGGILRHSQDFASWPPEALAKAKKHIAVYKTIRHLLKEDFYALFEQPRTLDAWDGWQYNNPQTGEGFVMVFRMRGDKARCRPELRGLQADATYLFVDPYSAEEFRLSGQTLMDDGLPIEIVEKNTAKMLHYYRQ